MTFTANNVADWFLSKIDTEAGDTISPLKLQKLIYYAQVWHYVNFQQPLFNDKIEAWRHGPVVYSVFNRFRDVCMGCDIIPIEEEIKVPNFSNEQNDLLQEVLDVYGEHSASFLEDLTHSEKPWQIARKGYDSWARCNEEITLKSIYDFYEPMKNGTKGSEA